MRTFRNRRSRAALLAALPLLLATACGTRMSHDDIVRAAAGSGGVGMTGTSSTGGVPGATGTTAPGGVPGATGPGAVPGGSAPGGVPGAPGGTTVTGPGGTTTTGGNHGQSRTTNGSGPQTNSGGGGDHTPVVLGQVGTFSGVVGASEGTAQGATQVWVKWMNAHGGLAGHPITFYSYDDDGSASKAQSEVRDLVENKHAIAIVGGFLPLTVQSVADYVDQHKVPVVGGDVTGPAWNQYPYLFPMGGSSDALSINTAQVMAQRGQKKIAILYCTESSSCSSAVTAVEKGAQKYGVQIVYKAAVSLAQPDFTAQCSQASQNGAQAIYMATGGDDAQRAARDCKKIPGFTPAWWSSALAVNGDMASDPNLDGLAIMSDVFPWMQTSTAAERAFQDAMKQYAPNLPVVGANAQAWASGQLLAAAVNALGSAATQGPLTSALVAQGLWQLRNETMAGLAPPLHFVQGKPAPPSPCTFYAQISHGRWTAPYGDKLFCY